MSEHTSRADWIPSLIEIADEAGEAIMEVYRRADIRTEHKEDDSPLTEADLRAQEIITTRLREATPSISILAEESADIEYETRSNWETFWLVDPLDGTKEFLKQNGEFTVNIALIEEGVPVLGVVAAPDLETTWWGVAGEGAYKRTSESPRDELHVDRSNEGPVTVVVSRSHINDATQDYVDRLEASIDRDVELMPVGSSLKLCMVAEGQADVYPRLAPTMEWDIGAAHCVVAEAGGYIETTEGKPLRYNKPDLLNPHFVVAASDSLLSI